MAKTFFALTGDFLAGDFFPDVIFIFFTDDLLGGFDFLVVDDFLATMVVFFLLAPFSTEFDDLKRPVEPIPTFLTFEDAIFFLESLDTIGETVCTIAITSTTKGLTNNRERNSTYDA